MHVLLVNPNTLDKQLEIEPGLPVLDGVISALKLLEGIVGYGLNTCKRLAYGRPAPKELVNLAPIFARPYQVD